MGRFLKKRSGDFFKSHFWNLGGVPNRSQEKVEMRQSFAPKKHREKKNQTTIEDCPKSTMADYNEL
jgi:hypothetical protein